MKPREISQDFRSLDALFPSWATKAFAEWFAYSYRIIYRVQDNVITVAAIVHGKRLLNLE